MSSVLFSYQRSRLFKKNSRGYVYLLMAPAYPALHAVLNNALSPQIELILLLHLLLCSEFEYLRSSSQTFLSRNMLDTRSHTLQAFAHLHFLRELHPFLSVLLPVTTSCIIGDLDKTVSSGSLVQPYRSSAKRRL